MSFMTEAVTGIGGREHNEDSYGFLEMNEKACWVVADGLGGHRGGDTASRVAVDAALASFRALPELSTTALERHLEAAQQAVLRAQKDQPGLSTMRTTIVMLLSDSQRAVWAHAGDTRLYCLENGHINFCTKDHSVVQAMVSAGELPANRIRHHEDRNRLLRSVGSEDDFRPTVESELRALHGGTSFLLCTDGFWEDVIEEEMEADFAKTGCTRDWLASMEARLRQRSSENSDNYTAIAVMFGQNARGPGVPASPGKIRQQKSPRTAEILVAVILLIALGVFILHGWRRQHALEHEVINLTSQRDALQKQSDAEKASLSDLQKQLGAMQTKTAADKTPDKSKEKSSAPKTK